jgi:hypothetical protein
MRCHLCGSQLVLIVQAGSADRAICPICLAIGEREAVAADPRTLKRGAPIDKQLRYLVDKARFPQRADRACETSAAGSSDSQTPGRGRAAES